MTKRTNGSDEMGKAAEVNFVNCCRQNSIEPTKSKPHADMFEHWDFRVNGYRVEVKGRKRLKRSDTSVNDDVIYIEFKNVRGNDGWILGRADYIAFERPNGFLIVPRVALLDLARLLIGDKWADRPTLYQNYRRRDRPDEHVGLIKTSDLHNLPHRLMEFK